MTNKRLQPIIDFELIWKSFHSKLDEDENEQLNSWLEASHDNRDYYEKAEKHFNEELRQIASPDFKNLKEKIEVEENLNDRSSRTTVARMISIAASVVIVIGLIFYLTNPYFKDIFQTDRIAKEQLEYPSAGTKQAVLHLGNGKRIQIGKNISRTLPDDSLIDDHIIFSSDAIKYKKGFTPTNVQKVAYHELEVQRASEFQIELADGTKIWINSESKLKYPTKFSNDKRVVELSGEAYFEVAHESNRPFEVILNNQTITVLGTSFNVSNYPQENTVSTLVDGKIQIETDGGEKLILEPNEQAIYDNTANLIYKEEVNATNYAAWKDDSFYFNREELGNIMKVLGRWYNIEVIYKDPSLQKVRFTGTLKRYDNFREVKNIIEMTDDVKITLKGNNKVIIE